MAYWRHKCNSTADDAPQCLAAQLDDVGVDQVSIMSLRHAHAGVAEDSRERVDISAMLEIPSRERVPADVRADEGNARAGSGPREDLTKPLGVLVPEPALG